MIQEVTLSEIIGEDGVFVDGDWVESKDQDINGDVRLIQLADIGDGNFINKSNRFLTLKKAKELNCTFLEPGDLLIARMPDPLGRACIFPGLETHCVTVVDICIVRPDKKIAITKWLKFMVNSYNFRSTINRFITGTTRQRISRGNLNKLRFNLPSIRNQIRIANILTKAEALISQRKETLSLLDELLKSTFLEMFGDPVKNEKGWPLDTIDNLCDDIVDCVNRTAPIVDFVTEYKMIRTTNVRNYKINFQDLRYVTKETYNLWTRRLTPKRGDIIFTREAPAGEAAIVDFDDKIFLGQRTMHFRPNQKKMTELFMLYQLMGADLKRQIEKLSSGSTVKHLSVPACKKFVLKVPPIKLQIQFAHIVEKTEALKAHYQTSLRELENLFGSLSQKAFKGELNLKEVEYSLTKAAEGNLAMAAEPKSKYKISTK